MYQKSLLRFLPSFIPFVHREYGRMLCWNGLPVSGTGTLLPSIPIFLDMCIRMLRFVYESQVAATNVEVFKKLSRVNPRMAVGEP